MRRTTRRTVRAGAQIGAVAALLVATLGLAPPASFAAGGTLAYSLNPDTTLMQPGSSTTVTVKNTAHRGRTRALVATLTDSQQFQKVDGCSGRRLRPGKECQITVTNTVEPAPTADQTSTLTVAGKRPGTTPISITFVVPGSSCRVTNAATAYTDLQEAIDAAAGGDTLGVRGTCPGNFTIDKDLTLSGVPGAGTPTLDAQLVGVVLTIVGPVSVTLHDVRVAHGTGVGGQAIGGGIENQGNLTLSGSASVSENFPSVGGGVLNEGTLTMNDSSSVSGNSMQAGAGILNGADGTVVMNDTSSVAGNTSDIDGGGIGNSGTLVMNDTSSVAGNTTGGDGGGVVTTGTFTMNGSSSVSGNTAGGLGGGILVLSGGVLNGATAGGNVHDNHPQDIVLP